MSEGWGALIKYITDSFGRRSVTKAMESTKELVMIKKEAGAINAIKQNRVKFYTLKSPIATIVLFFCIHSVTAQTDTDNSKTLIDSTTIERKIDSYLQSEMQMDNLPGISLAVIHSGKVILTRNIGFADKEAKKPITSETAFEIGSLTKQFTAAATMLLVEEEKLSLNDRILSYVDSTSGNWSAITVRQLLTHTSGIKDYTGVKELKKKMKQEFLDPKEVIQVMQALPLNFQPGEKHGYSNTNYFLLGLIITRVSGQPYQKFMEDRIFRPTGMISTRLTNGKAAPDLAQGYKYTGEKADYMKVTSDGGIISTSADLITWMNAFFGGKVIKKESLAEVLTPLTLNSGDHVDYGLGWIVTTDKFSGKELIQHGGFTYGFSNYITRLPTEDLTIIILTNSDRGYTRFYTKGIAAIYAPWLRDYWANDELDFREKKRKK